MWWQQKNVMIAKDVEFEAEQAVQSPPTNSNAVMLVDKLHTYQMSECQLLAHGCAMKNILPRKEAQNVRLEFCSERQECCFRLHLLVTVAVGRLVSTWEVSESETIARRYSLRNISYY
jgi:hypothetical protein